MIKKWQRTSSMAAATSASHTCSSSPSSYNSRYLAGFASRFTSASRGGRHAVTVASKISEPILRRTRVPTYGGRPPRGGDAEPPRGGDDGRPPRGGDRASVKDAVGDEIGPAIAVKPSGSSAGGGGAEARPFYRVSSVGQWCTTGTATV